MTGFPIRPLRDDFGPEPRNRAPVRNAEFELDGETVGRLMFHQLTGTGLLVDLAELALNLSSSGASILSRKEAWNVRGANSGAFAPPTLERTALGVWTITYPSEVPDWSGRGAPLVFNGGSAECLVDDEAVYRARVIPTSPPSSVVTLRCWVFYAGAFVPSEGQYLVVLR
ncbi:MAG: hypothetical protein ACOY0T_37440 [Myxococcota bacterium]